MSGGVSVLTGYATFTILPSIQLVWRSQAVISPFRTQLTRMIQNGEKDPSRSDVNRRSLERPLRRALWEAKNVKKKANEA